MSRRPLAYLAIASLLAAAGCSTQSPDPGSPPSAAPGDEAPVVVGPLPGAEGSSSPSPRPSTTQPAPEQPSTPDELADAVAEAWWNLDTTRDDSPADARRRAARYLTTEFAELNTVDLPGNPGAWWTELARKHGRYVVDVTDADQLIAEDLPVDSPTNVSRARLVELTPTNEKKWTGSPRVVLMVLELYRPATNEPWLVDDIAIEEALGATTNPRDFD